MSPLLYIRIFVPSRVDFGSWDVCKMRKINSGLKNYSGAKMPHWVQIKAQRECVNLVRHASERARHRRRQGQKSSAYRARRAAGCPHAEQECGSSSRKRLKIAQKRRRSRETREQLVCELIHIRERASQPANPLSPGVRGPQQKGEDAPSRARRPRRRFRPAGAWRRHRGPPIHALSHIRIYLFAASDMTVCVCVLALS